MDNFKIGYLDDDYSILRTMKRSLKKYDIELVDLKAITDVSDVNILIDYILDKQLECLFVDYDLMELDSKLYGTLVIKELNAVLPDFTCFLLTNYPEQGISEKLVQKIFVQDKSIFAEDDDSESFINFINKIKNSIECFRKRLSYNKEEYIKLLEKRKKEELNSSEEEKFLMLYHILKGYQYVDELPSVLLKSNTQEVLDCMLSTLNDLKQSIRKEG